MSINKYEQDEATFLQHVAADPYISPKTKRAVLQDRERSRTPPRQSSPNPFGLPAADDTLPGWTPLRALEKAGISTDVVASIESWFGMRNFDCHIKGFVRGARGSSIIQMGGVCYLCGRAHSNNHWILVNSFGYKTTRVFCHSSGESKNIPRLAF